jgi:hypothetical protein
MPSMQDNRQQQHPIEFYKKFDKYSWTKHILNKKKGPFTKQMPIKSPRRMKMDITNEKLIS